MRRALPFVSCSLAVALAASGCRGSVPRIGAGVTVAAYKYEEGTLKRVVKPGPQKVVAGQHYVSIAVEEVRIHKSGLPTPLALVMTIDGALPHGQDFTSILGVAREPEDDGYFKFDNPVVVSPFAYKGQPLVVKIALAPCTEKWADKIDAAKKMWGRVRHVDPNDYQKHEVDATHLGTDGSGWFTASFATMSATDALPLVAGRYVILSHAKPASLLNKVELDHSRGLLWKESQNPVTGVSFATIFVNRRKRGPRRKTPLELRKGRLEAAIGAGKATDAQAIMQGMDEMIAKDPHITEPERALEQGRLQLYRLRIERAAAAESQDQGTVKSKSAELLTAIADFRKKFKDILAPFELSELKAQENRYRRDQ